MSGYGPCYVEDCDDWKFAKGLCQRHYMRQYRYGRLELAPPKEELPCAVNAIDDCDRPVHARKMCKRHYLAWWKYGDPLIDMAREEGEFVSGFTTVKLAEAHGADCGEMELQPRWVWKKRRMEPGDGEGTLTPKAKHAYDIFCRHQVVSIETEAPRG